MANQINKGSIIISKEAVQKKGGVVVLDLNEYQRLCERAIPTYYLKGREAEKLDRLVEEGLKDYEQRKTIRASSMREALKIHAERKDRKR